MISPNVSEGSSPEIADVARDQGVVQLEVSIAAGGKGESVAACRGRGPGRVMQRFITELERAWPWRQASLPQAEEARRRYSGKAVGPVHSRGVAGVTPGGAWSSLEGTGGRLARDKEAYAIL